MAAKLNATLVCRGMTEFLIFDDEGVLLRSRNKHTFIIPFECDGRETNLVSWAHDWISDPSLLPVFETLPGASFIVNGATPAKNSALTSAGADLRLTETAQAGRIKRPVPPSAEESR
jgi:hypothetical protein